MDESLIAEISDFYRWFAEHEAHGRSRLYEMLALEVAEDSAILSFLAELPPPKRQPNLLFAAVKFLFGAPQDCDGFRGMMMRHSSEVREIMLSKSTQTNEPARCATLHPLLASFPQPIALLEVGAAAGLCLLPDRYAYEYGSRRIGPAEVEGLPTPRFSCSTNQAIPDCRITVAWRAGMDLEPIDATDDQQVAWLDALVWPGEEGRSERLHSALAIARRNPPRVVRGDLRTDLSSLAAEAPKGATLVVFHTAVLCYVRNLDEIRAFAKNVRRIGAIGVSNESPMVLPWVAEKVQKPWPDNRFLLSANEQPVAWADPHGTSVEWLIPHLQIASPLDPDPKQ